MKILVSMNKNKEPKKENNDIIEVEKIKKLLSND